MHDKTIINAAWGDDGCFVAARDFLLFSVWQPEMEGCSAPLLSLTAEVRLVIIGSCLQLGIDHHPSPPPSIPPFFQLLPHCLPRLSVSGIAPTTLISAVNGVLSSAQTNS